MKMKYAKFFLLCSAVLLTLNAHASGEAQKRWERMNQIRQEKFDRILPQVMREHGVDMWITMIREANYKTLHADFVYGYAGTDGFYVFTDRGGAPPAPTPVDRRPAASDRGRRGACGVAWAVG